jgi:hypothetical protein
MKSATALSSRLRLGGVDGVVVALPQAENDQELTGPLDRDDSREPPHRRQSTETDTTESAQPSLS